MKRSPPATSPAGLESFFCWSFNSRSGASASLRERVNLSPEQQATLLPEWLDKFRQSDPEASLLYIGTCHRVEIYGYAIDPNELLARWADLRDPQLAKVDFFQGVDAYLRMVRVAASLESEVLGETQITGQVKDALERARQLDTLHGLLDRSTQHALRAAKRIRTETSLGEGTVSVAHVAVDGLLDVFEDIQDKPVLVVGAGDMALQALDRILKLGARHVTWINRSRAKIEAHAFARYCAIADFERLPELIWAHAITVTATGAPHAILRLPELWACQALTKDALPEPRVLLDLGLPRNVDEKIHRRLGFLVRNVDEFRDRAKSNIEKRKRNLSEAEKILSEERSAFLRLWAQWGRGSLVAELYKVIEEITEHELAPFPLEERAKIGYGVKGIYTKMMHQLLQSLDGLDEASAQQVLEALVLAWRQPDRWQKQPPEAKSLLQGSPLLKLLLQRARPS